MRAFLAGALLLAACGGRKEMATAAKAPPPDVAPAAATAPLVPAVAETKAEPERRPVALVTDAAALAEVAKAGAAFGALVDDPSYRVVTRVIEEDVAAARRADPAAGVGVAGNAHRLFDRRWLTRGRYDLIGVAYRLDRMPMTPGRCGDVHLLYRLAYTTRQGGEEVSSRLPMTVALLLEGQPAADGCRAAAAAWMAPPGLAGAALGEWLVRGPMAATLASPRLTELRINVQLVRWPSAVRPDLGGHAEYLLRAFKPTGPGGLLARARLENAPDLPRLLRDRAARERLLAWVRDPAHLGDIERGTALLPDEFLAERAISVSPRGLSRRANRPFRQLLRASDLDAAALAGRPLIGSPEALIRRLDDMSCQGCHQSRTIAGFHLLGEDGADAAAGNALAVSVSAPLVAEVRRREALVAALAGGATDVDLTRPFAERPAGDTGASGARCGITADPGFAAWTCAPGLSCSALDSPADDALVGVCLPERGAVGDPCEIGAIAPNADAHRDRVKRAAPRACQEGVCNTNRVGFPGGMCTTSCADLPAEGACGVIALLTPFNNCLARGTPFPRCLAEHVSPAGLRRCSAEEPCRDDYICARTPGGEGACIPPYFLFQLRVDGHP